MVMTSPALRNPKSIWSYNPLPTGCMLYLPLWHPALSGPAFNAIGSYYSNCVVTTAAYGVNGRTFVAATPDYIEVTPTPTQLNFTTSDYSVIMRFTTGALTGSFQALYRRGLDTTDGYTMFFANNGIVYVRTSQTPGADQDSTAAMGTIIGSTSYTLGFSRAGASIVIYRNGIDVTAVSGTHVNPTTSSRTVKIGILDDKVNLPFNGVIHDIWVGGVNLTIAQHLHAHNVFSGRV